MGMEQQAGLAPRTEAQPFTLDGLTRDQREVVEKAVTFLASVANRADEEDKKKSSEPKYAFLPRIDDHRGSHALLIDGGRGVGKSSALLTLLRELAQPLEGDVAVDKLPVSVARLRERLRPANAIPLPILDLEAVPGDANLLLHLVGALHPLVKHLMQRGSEAAPWRAKASKQGDPDLVKERWNDLLHAAALSQPGALEGRRAQLDPEAFALELQESLLQHQHLGRAFRAFVDELVVACKHALGLQSPVFVVPIDDGDMNEEQNRPLLRLLRELHHPRVVFVVTGDSKRFDLAVREGFRQQYPKMREDLAGHRLDAPLQAYVVLEEDHARMGLSKVFPPTQRLELPNLRPSERLRFAAPSLKWVRAPAQDHPLQLQNFLEYLALAPQVKEVLPGNFRELISLGQWIDSIAGETQPLDADRFFAKLTNLTMGEPPEALARQVEKLEGRAWALEVTRTIRVADGVDLRVPSARRLFAEPPRSTEQRSPAWPKVGTEASQFVGAIDCAPSSSVPTPALIHTVRDGVSYPWPVPDWHRPLDHFALWEVLKAALGLDDEEDREVERNRTKETPPKAPRSAHPLEQVGAPIDAEELMKTYLLAVHAYTEWRARPEGESFNKLRERAATFSTLGWDELAKRLVSTMFEAVRSPADPAPTWALSAALLACPELEMSKDASQKLLEALKAVSGPQWGAIRVSAIKFRDELAQQATAAPYRAERQVDESHPWERLVGSSARDALSRATKWQDLMQRLVRLPAVIVEPARLPDADTSVRRYLAVTRRTWLERDAPTEALERWMATLALLGSSEGDTRLALRQLWTITKDLVAVEMPAVPEVLEPQQLAEIYAQLQLQQSTWRQLPTSNFARFGRVYAARGEFRWSEGRGLRHPMGRIVFEICWDFAVDAADRREMPLEPPERGLRWWRLGGSATGDEALRPWPAPDWWAFLDHSIVGRAWNDAVARAQRLAETFPLETVGDSLAFAYVEAVMSVAMTRSASRVTSTANPTRVEWERLLAGSERGRNYQGARWRCYQDWLERLPLLAAPESGLSYAAAEAILEHFGETPSNQAYLERSLRLVQNGLTSEEAEKELARIDAEHPDHPWARWSSSRLRSS